MNITGSADYSPLSSPWRTEQNNMSNYAASGASNVGFDMQQWLWLQQAGLTGAQPPQQTPMTMGSQPARFGTNLAQYLPKAQATGQPAQPMAYSGGLQMGGSMPGQMSGFPFMPVNYGWPFGQQGGQQATPQPMPPAQPGAPQLPPMQQMQPTNPFGALGLQAYQQQLGGQAGGLLPQPQPQAPAAPSTLDRYDQRFLDTMLKQYAGKDLAAMPAPQQEMVKALRAGQIPEALKKGGLYESLVTNNRASDQARAAAEAAKPWFLQQGKGGQLEGLTPYQRRQYLDQRAAAQQQYYLQNPGEIPAGMRGQPGQMGKFWSAMAGDYAPFMDKGQGLANQQQALYDKYQTILKQQGNIANNPAFEQFSKAWAALPGAARGGAAAMTPEQAYAATTTLGLDWNALPMGQDASIDVFLNGPMNQQDAAKYFGQQSLNRGLLAMNRGR
jgi:hypothetical protein